MKRVLVYAEPGVVDRPLVYDISTPLARDHAYLSLFRFLDEKVLCCYDPEVVDSAARQIYGMARSGNVTHARAFLLLFQEQVGFHEVDVQDTPEPRLAVHVQCPEAVLDENVPKENT